MVRTLKGEDSWQGVQERVPRVFLGKEGARWCICPDDLSADSLVYSFGVGEDVSFDLQLIEQCGARVYAFDPTPQSIAWVHSQVLPDGFVFHPYGVAAFDGICRFLAPENPAHVSHTILARPSLPGGLDLPVHRLLTIMKMLGHTSIDLLKMDIEGAEYQVINDLIECGIRPRQLLVEFHHRWPEVGIEKTRTAIRDLNCAGYRIFDVSASGEEYSFRTGCAWGQEGKKE